MWRYSGAAAGSTRSDRPRLPAGRKRCDNRTMTRPSLLPTAVLILCSATALLAARRLPKEVTEGRVLYGRYCASCHGLPADGRGPVAPALSHPPSDLRRLGERYGTPLPTAVLLLCSAT